MSYSRDFFYFEQARRNQLSAINESLDSTWHFFHLRIYSYLKNLLLNYRSRLHDVNIFNPFALRVEMSTRNRILNHSSATILRLKLNKEQIQNEK